MGSGDKKFIKLKVQQICRFFTLNLLDLNYLSTAKIISETKNLRPYFATHNAHTIAGIMHLYQGREDQFNFQRIFGMGDLTYRNAKKVYSDFPLTRVYAPVGSKKRATTLFGQKAFRKRG